MTQIAPPRNLFSMTAPIAMSKLVDPALCPLCGEANVCAMETARQTGAAPAPCWCLSVDFTAALAKPLPDAARGVACICARCAVQASAAAAQLETDTGA